MSAIADPEAPLEPGGEERELCRACLAPNPPGATFCHDCGAPLSSYAATGPFESVFAEGHVYRSAVERPQKLVVLLGMWGIFGMLASGGVMLLIMAHADRSFPIFLIAAFLVLVSVIILWRTTSNFLRSRNQPTETPARPDADFNA
jgi:hypothetical protein